MKRAISAIVLGIVSFAVSGAMVGCSAGVNVDPDRAHTSSSTTGDSTYRKTTVRDANGNVVETKTEKKAY